MKILQNLVWREGFERSGKPTEHDFEAGFAKLVITLDDVTEKLICSSPTELIKISPDKVLNYPKCSAPEISENIVNGYVRDSVKAWEHHAATDLTVNALNAHPGNLTAAELRTEFNQLVEDQIKKAKSVFNSAELQHNESHARGLRMVALAHLNCALAMREILNKNLPTT